MEECPAGTDKELEGTNFLVETEGEHQVLCSFSGIAVCPSRAETIGSVQRHRIIGQPLSKV